MLLRSGFCFLEGEEPLSVTRAPGVVLPEALALDRFAADGAGQLARIGVLGVWVLNAPGGALGAEEGAGVGHG